MQPRKFNTRKIYLEGATAKFNTRESYLEVATAKFNTRGTQKFRGFLEPRNLVPEKFSTFKVTMKNDICSVDIGIELTKKKETIRKTVRDLCRRCVFFAITNRFYCIYFSQFPESYKLNY